MRLALSSKTTFRGGGAVQAVWQDIGAYVSAQEAEQAVEMAAREVRSLVKPERVAYGWSGGKDSLALQAVMERAGVERCMLGIIPELEFHSYLDWLPGHAPAGLVTYENRALDLEWLAENQRYLFPQGAKLGYFYALASSRFAQRSYQEQHRPELQIFGRRRQDGNNCGRAGITRSKDFVSYNPLRDWPHELVLGVVYHLGYELPPVYAHARGWATGTGCWPSHHRYGPLEDCWDFVWEAEKERVLEAAELIDSAATYVRRVGRI